MYTGVTNLERSNLYATGRLTTDNVETVVVE